MPVKQTNTKYSRPRSGRCWSRTAVLSTVLATTVLPVLPVQASVLGQLQNSIHNLRSQRQNKYEASRQKRQQASTLKHRAMAVHERLEDTQRLLTTATETYENYLHQTKQTEARIIETRHKVQIAEREYQKHLDLFQRRLASFQRSGRPNYLQVVLGSRTLSDLTRRTYLHNAIAKQDAELHANLRESKLELEKMRNMLQSQWHQRNRLKQAAYREHQRIMQAESQQRTLLAEINQSRSAALSFAAAQDEAARDMEGTIRNLTARRAAIVAEYQRRVAAERAARYAAARRARVRAANARRSNRRSRNRSRVATSRQSSVSSRNLPVTQVAFHDNMVPESTNRSSLHEDFESHSSHQHDANGWGVPVRGRLSSRYGMRRHPVLKRTKLHTGADLAAAKGTPIRAAKNGTVLYAGWKKGYGNTVIIDHGDGVTTLYAHASKVGAKAGQTVQGGDYIGNVGSTGYSTGPHLHFEVRKNGRPVNPAPYLRQGR